MPWRSRTASVSDGHDMSKPTSARTTPSCGPSHDTSTAATVSSTTMHDPDPMSPSGPDGALPDDDAFSTSTINAPTTINPSTKRHGNRAGWYGADDHPGGAPGADAPYPWCLPPPGAAEPPAEPDDVDGSPRSARS